MASTKKVIVITGANTGIGLELVRALLRSNRAYHVFLGGRDIEKARVAAQTVLQTENSQDNVVEPFLVDIEDDASIENAFKTIAATQDHIDCLVNNAGASFDGFVEDGTMSARAAWNKAWDVNVTGAHIMTSTFLPLLLKSSDPRLIFITSGLSSLAQSADPTDPHYREVAPGLPKKLPFMGYRSSKAGLNMVMLEYAKALKGDGVKVWSIAPGLLATGLGGDVDVLKKLGAKDPSIGGEVIRNVIEGKRDADAGKVVREYLTPVQAW